MVIKQTMKTKRRRRFSQDFRDDAVRMVVIEGMEIGETAEKLGVGRSNLGRWKQQYLKRFGQQSSLGEGMNVEEMEGEIQDLRKRLRLSELQRDILKKALGILSQESVGGISS